jgi:hypothetical protein
VFCALLFFLQSLPFLSYAGLQNDEVLFAAALYRPATATFSFDVLHYNVPIMLMGYLGALKTWLYAPILLLWAPSSFSIRVPAALIGSLTIWIFFLLLEKLHGRRAAWVGALLLATDSMVLLTTSFDWGPVALQHLLFTSGAYLAVRFHGSGRLLYLYGAAFAWGVALWDKALFIWIFSGLVVVFAPWFRRVRRRAAAGATLAFCLGALPLLGFNLLRHRATLHSTSGFTTAELSPKWRILRSTWNGSALFGYLVNEDSAERPRPPANALENTAFRVRGFAGERRRNGLEAAFLVALLLTPALWRTRSRPVLLISLIAMSIAWIEMAVTKGAGAAAHHTVLLWPLPHIFLAVAFAEASGRMRGYGTALLGIGIAWLISLNLLVTNQYLYQFARNGAAGSWSDAIYPLSDALRRSGAARIGIADWGMLNSLVVLNEGRLPVEWVAESFRPGRTDLPPAPNLPADRGALWVSHTAGNEQFQGVNAGLAAFAERAGYEKRRVTLIYDRNGRAIFDVFRLVPRVPVD